MSDPDSVDKEKMSFGKKMGMRFIDNPKDVRHLATEYAALGMFEMAIEQYDEYRELFGKDAEVLALKAHAHGMLGEADEALEDYDAATQKKRKNAWIWALKGDHLQSMERYSEAVLCYHKALEHGFSGLQGFLAKVKKRDQRGKANILGNIANCYAESGTDDDLRLAKEFANKSLELDPEQNMALSALAIVFEDEEKWKELLDISQFALNLDEDDSEFLKYIAIAHLNLDNLDEAYTNLKKALAIDELDDSSWYNLACYYALIGENENAIDKLTVAIHLDPSVQEDMSEDWHFKFIKTTPEFQRLLEIEPI